MTASRRVAEVASEAPAESRAKASDARPSREEAEEYFGLPVIAEIPEISREYKRTTDTLVYEEPLSRVAESYRALRSSLVYVRAFDDPETSEGKGYEEAAERQPEVVMITSPGAGEGKTTTVANLSAALAEAGYHALLVGETLVTSGAPAAEIGRLRGLS